MARGKGRRTVPLTYERGDDVLGPMAQELIRAYHSHLLSARVAFVFRSKASKRGGKVVLGQASKLTPRLRPLFVGETPPDFVIVVGADTWNGLTEAKRLALIDHELCHCQGEEGDGAMKWRMQGHDVEEFLDVAGRHGTWTDELASLAKALR